MVILIRKDVKLMMVFKAIEGKKTYVVGDQGEEPNEVLKAANKRFKTSKKNLTGRLYVIKDEYLYHAEDFDTQKDGGKVAFGVTTVTRK